MSKLAHSNDETMAIIERQARTEEVGKKICTSYWAKPIPPRQFDWSAWFDGEEEGHTGYGKTEGEAIDDLLEMELS